jgi:hypothetical protein
MHSWSGVTLMRRLAVSRIVLLVLLVLAQPIIGTPHGEAWAQDVPPLPVGELVERFLEDPSTRIAGWGVPIPAMTGTCPDPGTWQRQLLGRLLAVVPADGPHAGVFIGTQTYNVTRCGIPELDSWYHRTLVTSGTQYFVYNVARGLWLSGRAENRAAVVSAIFDEEVREDMRDAIAGQLVSTEHGLGTAGLLQILADGYRLHGTAPPGHASMIQLALSHADPGGRSAKVELLRAWRDRPEAPGSARLLALLVNDALSARHHDLHGAEEWSREVSSVLEAVLDDEIPVSDQLRQEVERMIARFRPRSPPGPG